MTSLMTKNKIKMYNTGSGAPVGAPEFFICRANLIIPDMQNAGGVPLLGFFGAQ